MPIVKSQQETSLKILINSRRQLIVAILLIWGTVGLLFFALKPQIENIFKLNQQLNHQKDQFQRVTRKLNELKLIQVSDQFREKEKVDEVLPSHKPVLELMANLYQAVTQTQVTIEEFVFHPGEIASPSADLSLLAKPTTGGKKDGPVGSSRKFQTLKLELTVSGKNENVNRFLDYIEKIAPFTSIIELNLHTSQKMQKGSLVELSQAELILNSYYYTQVITTNIDDSLPSVGEKELRAFNTIQQFLPSDFVQPTEIQSANIEDLFGIKGFEF
ncbi:MAG TPA: hypothetical protein PLM16_01525 [Candidatus Woesebacteria bacterium]|nr:hypothetical protein [Candidatus Woesebacteria bacterium]